MAAFKDVQDYLNSLLVTDQRLLTFLHNTILERDKLHSLEQASVDLAAHVREHQGSVPSRVRKWLSQLSTLDVRSQGAIIIISGYYRDDSISDLLEGVLNQVTYANSHRHAVAALARVRGVRASKTLTDMLWRRESVEWGLREDAILAELGLLGWSSSIEHLIRALGAPHERSVQCAARSLARFAPDDVLNPLLRLLGDDSNAHQAVGAAEALGLLKDERAIPALQRASRGSRSRLATAAAVALARLGEVSAEERLVELAYGDRGHEGADMRESSINALGLLAASREESLGESAFNTLYSGLSDSQPEVRGAAARALGKAGRASSARHLAEALKNEVNPLRRIDMVWALGCLAHSMSVPVLLASLRRDEVIVKIEILKTLSRFNDPALAQHMSAYRQASDPRLVDAANRALRRLLYRPFTWPRAAALEEPMEVSLYSREGARQLVLPPPPPRPPSFFERLFGGGPVSQGVSKPASVGLLRLSPERVELALEPGHDPAWQSGVIDWSRRFSLQVTREPIGGQSETDRPEDIGVHIVMRQRAGGVGARFETVALSLWCAPSESVARLQAQGARLPCLDPHQSEPLLGALRWYMALHGEPMNFVG